MAELEPGHPDELLTMLTNWLNQANDPIRPLPANTTPTEWAVRNFISAWRKPVRAAIEEVEASLTNARAAIESGHTRRALSEIESARQTLAVGVREELGLYEWNREAD